jgi:hypothetical protein
VPPSLSRIDPARFIDPMKIAAPEMNALLATTRIAAVWRPC